jgi:hypothetical protein
VLRQYKHLLLGGGSHCTSGPMQLSASLSICQFNFIKSGNMAHCVQNALACRYMHMWFTAWRKSHLTLQATCYTSNVKLLLRQSVYTMHWNVGYWCSKGIKVINAYRSVRLQFITWFESQICIVVCLTSECEGREKRCSAVWNVVLEIAAAYDVGAEGRMCTLW